MKQKHRRILLVILTLAALLSLPAYGEGEGIGFSIRYYDKRIYHAPSDPILVQVTVTNNSPAAFRFKLADDRVFSVDFTVKTASNRDVPVSARLLRKRSNPGQVFFREVTIEQDESFSFIEDLRDYADLSRSGSYVVQAALYPELYRPVQTAALPAAIGGGGIQESLASNRLGLVIKPPLLPGMAGVEEALDEETREALVREKLPPDEVVTYTLQARQRSQWAKFYLYLDLESLLARNPVRQREWRSASEEGRSRMIERYKEELRQAAVDHDIAVIPQEFTIERTEYNNNEGMVTVLERFHYRGYNEKKRFIYHLYRKNDLWAIVDYEVANLGTE